jgi:hypothetical protein
MSIESARRDVTNHQQQIARLQSDKAKEARRVADALGKASSAVSAANATTNLSTRASKLREAQRYNDAAAKYQKQVSNVESKIAAEQKKLSEAQRKVYDAEKKFAEEQGRHMRKQTQEMERASREHERQMRELSNTLDPHSRLHATTMERLSLLPEKIHVLFLAANPIDQAHLRLDEEVRAIAEMIRKSSHRDAVRLESRWAIRPLDLLQALNEVRPRIVHFSGHGSSTEDFVFQDDEGASKFVSKEAIGQTMAATAGGIQLVFFNSCYSRSQAESVTRHVPSAIGMNSAIGDQAARVFLLNSIQRSASDTPCIAHLPKQRPH